MQIKSMRVTRRILNIIFDVCFIGCFGFVGQPFPVPQRGIKAAGRRAGGEMNVRKKRTSHQS
ncbi:hypothetical protein [Pacificoceanicola onchidii]|uniref:hypothetical protein n=1 Tax=Pacificoceanicola onchidii TaxID=2562685 RepID=UPI0010A68B8F|nr:hypothetical protein [Pacificoceanicola onchidii]